MAVVQAPGLFVFDAVLVPEPVLEISALSVVPTDVAFSVVIWKNETGEPSVALTSHPVMLPLESVENSKRELAGGVCVSYRTDPIV